MAVQSETTPAPAPTDGAGDSPVFVDPSGRRRGVVRLVGLGLGAALVVGVALVVAGLFGASPVPLPGWPGAEPVRGEAPGTAPRTSAPVAPRPATGRATTGAPNPGHGPATTGAPKPTTVPTTNPGSDNRHVPSPKPPHGRP
ncbi:hypothetical protein Lfu02_59350 [Longispora fulva]|uniref:Uncharacterized protein n=1 Tax=Longispora fulva TaxID=619741 RepID=A0A8J7GRX1_9ACTN|nr:hypothetical protein [Longispora fulva]MBG6137083.1 hypothetical protein [Longispora fulva]GIG61563.1 hypothetical protein Lfu02_59350 [Longispora fulva]